MPVVEPALPVHPPHRESEAPTMIPRKPSVAQPGNDPSIPAGQPPEDVFLPPTSEQPSNNTPAGEPVGVPSRKPINPANTQPTNPRTQPSANQPQEGNGESEKGRTAKRNPPLFGFLLSR